MGENHRKRNTLGRLDVWASMRRGQQPSRGRRIDLHTHTLYQHFEMTREGYGISIYSGWVHLEWNPRGLACLVSMQDRCLSLTLVLWTMTVCRRERANATPISVCDHSAACVTLGQSTLFEVLVRRGSQSRC